MLKHVGAFSDLNNKTTVTLPQTFFVRMHNQPIRHPKTTSSLCGNLRLDYVGIAKILEMIKNYGELWQNYDKNAALAEASKMLSEINDNDCIKSCYHISLLLVRIKRIDNFSPVKSAENRKLASNINPSSTNPTKWSNTVKQFVVNSRRIVCLAILWGLRLKVLAK